MRGVIKSWNAQKGFGFIGVQGEPDAFVHVSALTDDLDRLSPGDLVQFELGEGRNGRRCATHVVVME